MIITEDMIIGHLQGIKYYEGLKKYWGAQWNNDKKIRYSYLPEPLCFISCPILLSLLVGDYKKEPVFDEKWILDLIEERNIARKQKDFTKADQIRNKLLEQNIILKDTPKQTIWERIR